MFFENLSELENCVRESQTVILCLSDGATVGGETFSLEKFAKKLGAIVVEPKDGKIKTEEVRDIISICVSKQQKERFFIFKNAESMVENAANALLKILEEPLENYHFVLCTSDLGAILPTIRSRAAIYAPKVENCCEEAPRASEEVLGMAKQLLTAKPAGIKEIAEKISKKKEAVRREFALSVLSTAIDLSYKSYFKTKNSAFLTRLPKLIAAFEGIRQNGNLKLQFIGNLI